MGRLSQFVGILRRVEARSLTQVGSSLKVHQCNFEHMFERTRGGLMEERREAKDLQSLAEDIRQQTADWPSSMRAPRPGTDLMWERIISGPSQETVSSSEADQPE